MQAFFKLAMQTFATGLLSGFIAWVGLGIQSARQIAVTENRINTIEARAAEDRSAFHDSIKEMTIELHTLSAQLQAISVQQAQIQYLQNRQLVKPPTLCLGCK